MSRECYRAADLEIDVGGAEVTRRGEPVELPALSFATLVLLVRRSPDVVSHDELVAQVWGGAAIADETITQRIALLRRALGDDSKSPRYVRSVRGRGYRLVPTAARIAGAGAARARRPRRRALAVAAGLGVAVTVSLVVLERSGGPAGRPPSESRPAPSSAGPSVDELMARAREYLGRHRESDNELAEGLFRQALASSPGDARALAGLSLAYSQRASKFNQPLTWARRAEEMARSALAAAPDLAEAHHALGLALDAQGRVTPALSAYRRAATLDPTHAGAVASAAYLYFVSGELAEALRWNLRALELGGDLPYGEVQVAETLATLGFGPAAETWYRQAVALRPDNLFAAAAYASWRLTQGNLAGADELVALATDRGVHRPELQEIRGHLALLRGDTEGARTAYRAAVSINPRQTTAASRLAALEAHADPEIAEVLLAEALATGESARADGDEWPSLALDTAIVAAGAGRSAAALAALDQAIALGYRNASWLLVDPAFATLRTGEGFWPRIERIRALVAAERARVLAANWRPAGLADSSG